jgi:HEAT repeat protein
MKAIAIVGTLLLAGAAAGCSNGEQADQEAWSTRSESVLASDLKRPELKVYQPIAEDSSLAAYRDAAVEVLLQAADADDPLLRANAIEALHGMPQYLAPVVRKGLLDANRGVRFVAVMTVGQQRLVELASLVQPLVNDEAPSVRAAALYALNRCGMEVDLTPLADLLFMDSAEVRANTAGVLGDLGNRTAIPMLKVAAKRPLTRADSARKKIVDLQIAEALVRLGRDEEIEVIQAALFAPGDQGEIVALACQIAGRLTDRQALPTLLGLALREGVRQQSAEIRMAATLAIARIDAAQTPLSVPREYVSSPHQTLRAQAALTLGMSGRSEVLGDLGPLLSDPEPLVQVSAAGAILRVRADSPPN